MTTRMTQAALKLVDAGHPNSQRVAILDEPRRLSLAYAEIPKPGDGELRVKIKWVGVCGSDVESYRGTRRPEFVTFPARLGHEVAGVIDQLGPNVEGLRVGDQVTCRYVWGAFAEYIVCRPFNVKVVPPSFPLIDTSLIEILPGVLHAVEIAQISQRTSVLIMGQGVSGLVLTQVVRLHSPKALVVTDLNDRNLRLAKKYGATHTYKVPAADTSTRNALGNDFPDGFDVVFPCLLEGDGMVDAIDCAAFAGKVVMYGCIGVCNAPIDFLKVHRKRLDIFSTEPKRDIDMRRFYDQGTQLVLDGLVNTSEIVTHRIPLSRIGEAFALRDDSRSDAIHVLVDCEA
ncbi:MAG TPA: alcohol dehydrogenase catalytic domain-containing protein [Acidobacteriaceae bacterium]|nr:alcohol dehydrogenase catalytic domain-containing protein [Acidobacteriaceae bacterium]